LTQRARLAMLKVHRFRGRRAEMAAELGELLPVLRRADTRAGRERLHDALAASVHLAIDEGRYPAARDTAREVVALATSLYGEAHVATAEALLLEVSIGQFLGDAAETLRLATAARDRLLRVHGAETAHAKVLDGRFMYGRALGNVGRYREARAEFERAERSIVAVRGADAPLAIDAGTLHAAALARLGRLGEAWRRLEPRLAAVRSAPPLMRYRGLHTAGLVRRLQGDLSAAAALQDEAFAALPEQPVQLPRRNLVLGERALVALEQGDAAAALGWLDRVQRPDGSVERSLEEAGRQTVRGRALLALGRPAQALPALQAAEARWRVIAPAAAEAQQVAVWRARAERAAAAAPSRSSRAAAPLSPPPPPPSS
jgi:tetratricopeptide (TPR) repeat protein